jgi:hypothetical protein
LNALPASLKMEFFFHQGERRFARKKPVKHSCPSVKFVVDIFIPFYAGIALKIQSRLAGERKIINSREVKGSYSSY